MNWVIDKNIRCDLLTYSGTNYSGKTHRVQIFPSGRQGDLSGPIGSLIWAGPFGLRLTLCTSAAEEGWEAQPWRAIVMVKGNTFRTRDGRHAVRLPDIELLHRADAHRVDPDFEQSYDFAEDLASGKGWSYGRVGPLHDRVQCIRIDRVA